MSDSDGERDRPSAAPAAAQEEEGVSSDEEDRPNRTVQLFFRKLNGGCAVKASDWPSRIFNYRGGLQALSIGNLQEFARSSANHLNEATRQTSGAR